MFKISGSLGFLKGMRKFAEIVNEVNQYILQIEGMNRELYPSALSLKNRIKADIDKTNGQIQDTQGVIDELEKKVLPLEEKLKLKQHLLWLKKLVQNANWMSAIKKLLN